jgi:hypothetical protein
MFLRTLILLISGCVLPFWAQADPDAALEAFRHGDYERALLHADDIQQPDVRALRARILLAQAVSAAEGPPDRLVFEALQEAEEAIRLQPRHIEARLQKAIALSLLLRSMSLAAAARTGYGDQSRTLAEAVLEDDPGNFYAHGFLAVWHVEVVRRGGMIGAGIMGASVRLARQHHAAATVLKKHDIGLNWQWARALAGLDPERYRAEIIAALDEAVTSTPQTELDRVMQQRAGLLLEVARSGQTSELSRLARSTL